MLLRQLILLLVVMFPLNVLAEPPHLDKRKLPYGCGTCHVGFDFRSGGGQGGCLNCHGNSVNGKGLLGRGIDLKSVESDFRKPYHHPVFETRGIHSSKETLPETDPKAPRHVDCVDCHNPHLVSPDNRFAGIKGKKTGNTYPDITKESELCYKCHAESANLPGRYTNKRAEFALNNPSYHPVEGEGKNYAVVSLLKPYKEKKVNPGDISTISCSDCHGSDNPASKGLHGSIFPYILVDNYSIKDGEPESSFAYALCYRCHSRSSILSDESFKYHSLHIRGKNGAGGTSCHTCHNSHGSAENKYLIKFDSEIVSPNSVGMLKFVSKGISVFSGECYLSCHGVDHNPKSY